ncbi:MAG: sugar phosphate nucleotidyltransferase [Planctomycetota bacterium]
MLHAVIMAGGSGTRFWPRSRERSPKQLQAIGTARALIAETCDRIMPLVAAEAIHVITSASYADQVRALLPQVPASNVVGEPVGRDTAAAIGLAALRLRQSDADAIMIVMPADHIIAPREAFHRALRAGAELLAQRPETLITFGIKPHYPATGFGYIKRGRDVATHQGVPAFVVDAFVEKPRLELATEYVRAGSYYWNAGIFAWRASTILRLIETFLPELHRGLLELAAGSDAHLGEIYARLPKISIDFGVMERAPDRVVLEAPFRWDDVGSWRALERHVDRDAAHNVALGETVLLDARGNIVDARGGLAALIGVQDLVVVHTPDVTLVCHKDRAEDVKRITEMLRARGATQYL